MSPQRFIGLASWLCLWMPTAVLAQGSQHALRFYGTGVGPPGQQDRALLPIDDNEPGPDGSAPSDVGAGDFTLELWVRGQLSDNSTANSGGDVEAFEYNWIEGNILLDRDIWCGSERKYGISLAGGLVRFGTASGDPPDYDPAHTLEGDSPVLDGAWHHVAVVRDAASGIKSIVVDGQLDFESSAGVSTADLSYPDDGIPVTPESCGPGQLTPYGWYLVIAAEKHDAGEAYPSFNGFVDELRIWNVARSASEIAADRHRILAPGTPGLVAAYRFEEGAGMVLTDTSAAGSPDGELVDGVTGNGEWVSFADDPANTAPVGSTLVFADGFESGDTSAWQ